MSVTSARRPIVVLLCVAALWSWAASAAEQPETAVPRQLATILDAARDALDAGDYRRAIRALQAYDGEDHALRHLLLGHAQMRGRDLDAAAAAYRRALEMDGGLDEARKALAQIYVRQERWDRAAPLLGRVVRPQESDAEWLALYAQVAAQTEDWRLCRLLVDHGIMRFPEDRRFRQLDLSLLVREERFARAAQVAMGLLSRRPTDTDLWGQLADIRAQQGQDGARRAALEAAVLCDPGNLQRHRQLLLGELAAGNWLSVLRRGRDLLTGPLADEARNDADVMDLLIRAADRGERDGLLREWLAVVPEEDRTRAMRIAEARMSLRAGEPREAREVLRKLIEMGEADASVYLWAGRLAEQAKDYAEAEAYYERARSAAGASARLAVLYLARLNLDRARYEQARQLLRGYLKDRPEDAAARALLAVVEQALNEQGTPER